MRTMIRIAIPSALLLLSATPVFAADPIIEECHGTETVKVGAAEPKSLPYDLTFKIDFSNKTYCYGPCTKDQTYPIADAKSSPIKLSDLNQLYDLDKGPQVRHLVFDQASAKITDYQVFSFGLGIVTRNASALCKSAKP